MNRRVTVVGLLGICGWIGVSHAEPPKPGQIRRIVIPTVPRTAPAPAAKVATPEPAKSAAASVTAYMRPTLEGVMGPIQSTPAQSVTLTCMPDYVQKLTGVTGHCFMDVIKSHSVPVSCQPGSKAYTEDRLPHLTGVAWGQVDQCIGESSGWTLKENFSPAICDTRQHPYVKNVQAGVDRCTADIRTRAVATPGYGAMPNAIAYYPLAGTDLEQRSVKCPSGWTLKAQENYFVCVRN